MRRAISVAMCVLLATALVVPAAAWADNASSQNRGNSGSGNGQQTSLAVGQTTQAQDRVHQDALEDDELATGGQTKDVPPGLAKAKEKSAGRGEPSAAAAQARSRARVRVSQDTSPSVETSPTRARDRDRDRERLRQFEGIENALARIRHNVAKAEQRMADGEASQVPPGLLRVMEKFMAWLGLAPGSDAAHDDESTDDGGGSQETSGSVEPSLTPGPDGGVD